MATTLGSPAVIGAPYPQDPSCLLLSRVPREIRDKIYHFTFEGDEVNIGPKHRATARRFRPTSTNTNHSQLLLTCRQVYDEARPVFCAEMRLIMQGIPRSFDGDIGVSAFTQARVRQVAILDDEWLYHEPSTRAFLGRLPRLEVCILPRSTQFLLPPQWDIIFKSEESILADIVGDHGPSGRRTSSSATRLVFEEVGGNKWRVTNTGNGAMPALPSGASPDSLTGPQMCLVTMGLTEVAERIMFVKKFIFSLTAPRGITKHKAVYLNYSTGKFFISEDENLVLQRDSYVDKGHQLVMSEDTATDG